MYNVYLPLSPPKHARGLTPFAIVRGNFSRVVVAKLTTTHNDEPHAKTLRSKYITENGFRFHNSRPGVDKAGERFEKMRASSTIDGENNGNDMNNISVVDSGRKNKVWRQNKVAGDDKSSLRSREKNSSSTCGKVRSVKRKGEEVEKKIERGKGSKKSNFDSGEVYFRLGLDMCSKRGDVKRAIEFFDWAQRDGIKLGQYHYTVLLYLCSSASVGVVRAAKSGTSSRSLDVLDSLEEVSKSNHVNYKKFKLDGLETDDNVELDSLNENEKINRFCNGTVKRSYRLLDGLSRNDNDDDESDAKGRVTSLEDQTIRVDEELKEYARKKGFEIFEKMRSENVPVNEATLTSVARIAMSMDDGDMAFDMVKHMKSLGINPRLRSYSPALSAFCKKGDIDKAFAVEKHMLENGVYPEEPELQALLRLSVENGKGDKVYYLLHKLRSDIRKVSASTADLIVDWFSSKAASRVGKTKWDKRSIQETILNGGGGWHGKGWLGRGKWSVLRTNVGTDGFCQCCREKLAIVDLDPKETESFAESVASIAIQRDSNFKKFQKWLDYYGPFEAVVDGANIGLFSQKRFMPSKINAVVNGIRQKLPSKKRPLIILHNRHFNGPRMKEPLNRALFDKWRNADAIYATPTGSNDDWYWLYAAIKFKSFLVTNDEMRDHTFQLLGNDFFPKWKERHQVRFSFSDGGPEFLMPPPCSVVIQESDNGHWHIPVSSGDEYEETRSWLCIMRAKSRLNKQDSKLNNEGFFTEIQLKDRRTNGESRRKTYKNLRDILSGSTFSDHHSIVPKLERSEEIGGCVVDFQI